METELSEKLKSFECRRCGECCRQPGYVYLTVAEADRIAERLGMDPFLFVDEYCDIVERRRLVLKKKPDESCVFLEANDCRIHDAKPKQCVDFPVRWRTARSLDYCEGLKALGIKTSELADTAEGK